MNRNALRFRLVTLLNLSDRYKSAGQQLPDIIARKVKRSARQWTDALLADGVPF